MDIIDELSKISSITDLKKRAKHIAKLFEQHYYAFGLSEPSRDSTDHFAKAYETLIHEINVQDNSKLIPYNNATWIGDIKQLLNFFSPKSTDIKQDNAYHILESKFIFRPPKNEPLFDLDF